MNRHHNAEKEMMAHCLDELKQSKQDYDPYPAIERYRGGDDTIPVGPWWVGEHTPLPNNIREVLKDYRCVFDKSNRPLHPWYEGLLEACGVVSGTGKYWHWGPNYTADPVLIVQDSNPKLLLIQRSDNHKWALPGGFIDDNELPIDAARREAHEEAHIDLSYNPGTLLYEGIVADERTTAHAWAHTFAFLFIVDKEYIAEAGDDAQDAEWFSVYSLPENVHGSHKFLINKALESL